MKRFFERLHQGHRTLAWPKAPAKLHPRFRGLPTVDQGKCQAACSACSDACPTGAISTGPSRIDLGKCLFCPVCTEACPTGAIGFTNDFRLGASTRQALVTTGKDYALAQAMGEKLRRLLAGLLVVWTDNLFPFLAVETQQVFVADGPQHDWGAEHGRPGSGRPMPRAATATQGPVHFRLYAGSRFPKRRARPFHRLSAQGVRAQSPKLNHRS
jgi:ferredoxin